jgi:hypothetical protein
METITFKEELLSQNRNNDTVIVKKFPDLDELEIFPKSIHEYLDVIFLSQNRIRNYFISVSKEW